MTPVPPDIRIQIMKRLWKIADELDWMALSNDTRSRHYDNWTKDPKVGGILARFLAPTEVRHYIKDGLLKIYCREKRGSELVSICRLAGIDGEFTTRQTFERPNGCVLQDGTMITWGAADGWKIVLMSAFERWHLAQSKVPHAVVFTRAASHFGDLAARGVVETAASRLDVGRVVWRDA